MKTSAIVKILSIIPFLSVSVCFADGSIVGTMQLSYDEGASSIHVVIKSQCEGQDVVIADFGGSSYFFISKPFSELASDDMAKIVSDADLIAPPECWPSSGSASAYSPSIQAVNHFNNSGAEIEASVGIDLVAVLSKNR